MIYNFMVFIEKLMGLCPILHSSQMVFGKLQGRKTGLENWSQRTSLCKGVILHCLISQKPTILLNTIHTNTMDKCVQLKHSPNGYRMLPSHMPLDKTRAQRRKLYKSDPRKYINMHLNMQYQHMCAQMTVSQNK